MRGLSVLTVLVLGVPLAVSAESYRHGRVRSVEGDVSIQRGSETGTEEAAPNMPFLPGDRVWTDGAGRAEFQFAGGSIVRVDTGSKLDYVTHDEGREEQVTLRLWSGALYFHGRDRDPAFGIETPGGVVSADGRAVVRVDVQSGELRLSVYEGDATLEDGRGVRVRAGERVYARRGEILEGPQAFDRAEGDAFASWDEEQQQRMSAAANRPAYVPDEVAPYYGELESHGSWYHVTDVGNVWRPYVGAGWQPYYNGRWMWTAYGWTWVPAETWGWAPSHFGRWGWSPALGWYWIPGRTWGPAWVSWASGGDYFGWCPLGYRDRPVLVRQFGNRGHAVPRGTGLSAGATETVASPWVYLRRGDVSTGEVARRRAHPDASALQRVRVVEATQGRLTKELVVSEVPSGAISRTPRNVSTRPGIGDTVPELRSDPMTTIPVARRRGGQDAAGIVRSQPGSAVIAAPGTSTWSAPAEGATGEPRALHPTDARSIGRRLPPAAESGDEGAGARTRRSRGEAGIEGPPPERPIQERRSDPERGAVAVPRDHSGVSRDHSGGNEDAQREVLRPVFKPLSRPRGEEGDRGSDRGDRAGATPPHREVESRPHGGGEARPREYAPPVRENRPETAAPPRAAAPPPAPPRQEGEHARRREKENQ